MYGRLFVWLRKNAAVEGNWSKAIVFEDLLIRQINEGAIVKFLESDEIENHFKSHTERVLLGKKTFFTMLSSVFKGFSRFRGRKNLRTFDWKVSTLKKPWKARKGEEKGSKMQISHEYSLGPCRSYVTCVHIKLRL